MVKISIATCLIILLNSCGSNEEVKVSPKEISVKEELATLTTKEVLNLPVTETFGGIKDKVIIPVSKDDEKMLEITSCTGNNDSLPRFTGFEYNEGELITEEKVDNTKSVYSEGLRRKGGKILPLIRLKAFVKAYYTEHDAVMLREEHIYKSKVNPYFILNDTHGFVGTDMDFALTLMSVLIEWGYDPERIKIVQCTGKEGKGITVIRSWLEVEVSEGGYSKVWGNMVKSPEDTLIWYSKGDSDFKDVVLVNELKWDYTNKGINHYFIVDVEVQ